MSLADSAGSSAESSADEQPGAAAPPPLKRALGAPTYFSTTYFSTRRLHEDIVRVRRVGAGHFGTVYEVVHRLDGHTYALKKSKYPVAAAGFSNGLGLVLPFFHVFMRLHVCLFFELFYIY